MVLKIFPGEAVDPNYIRAIRAVLPKDTKIYVTGGIRHDNMQSFIQSGVNGFGFGGALYKPGATLDKIKANAEKIMFTYHEN